MGNDIIQPPLCDVYPDVLANTDTIKPSDPQRLIVNKMAAHAVMMYMSEILEDKCKENHTTVFHAKKGYMRTAAFD